MRCCCRWFVASSSSSNNSNSKNNNDDDDDDDDDNNNGYTCNRPVCVCVCGWVGVQPPARGAARHGVAWRVPSLCSML